MKITDLTAYPVWNGKRNRLFVVVDTDEGISGVGEAGIAGREKAIMGALEHFKPLLIDMDPFRIEHIWQMLFRGGFFPAQRILTSAISAIDIALWDIKGKALGVPVYELLGGRVRDKVVCYPHNDAAGLETEPLLESCLATKADGWKFVRWSLGHPGERIAVSTAAKQFHAVREAVGDEIEIIFDVHTRFEVSDAVWFCNEVAPLRPYFIEDPLRCENSKSYKSFRARTAVPLAAGEQYSSKWEFREVIENEWIDYARVDLCIAGGITEAKKIAGWCETHYINLATHNPLGPVSAAACLHLNLACSNVAVQEQPRKPYSELTDVIPVQIEWEDGYLLPPTRPGLGIEFDRDVAEKAEFHMYERPYFHRSDGAFTNW